MPKKSTSTRPTKTEKEKVLAEARRSFVIQERKEGS